MQALLSVIGPELHDVRGRADRVQRDEALSALVGPASRLPSLSPPPSRGRWGGGVQFLNVSGRVRGSHSSSPTCLTQIFFKNGGYSTLSSSRGARFVHRHRWRVTSFGPSDRKNNRGEKGGVQFRNVSGKYQMGSQSRRSWRIWPDREVCANQQIEAEGGPPMCRV